MAMRLAEKRDDAIEPIAPDGSAADGSAVDAGAANKQSDGSGAPPPASLTASLIRRNAVAKSVEDVELLAGPAIRTDARAQQAVLEEAFAEPASDAAAAPETTDPQTNTEAPEAPDVSAVTDTPDATDASDVAAVPEATDSPDANDNPEAPDVRAATDTPDATGASDAKAASKITASPDTSGFAPAAKAPQATGTQDTPDGFNSPHSPDAMEPAVAAAAPVRRAAPIEREAFQSVRQSAAEWNLFRAPSASFWDRLVKDVAIFTIFFAVLVFVILQVV